jgi:hypothetical protein
MIRTVGGPLAAVFAPIDPFKGQGSELKTSPSKDDESSMCALIEAQQATASSLPAASI